jgi:hypothetical protein
MLELKDMREQLSSFEQIGAYILGAQYYYSGDGAPEEFSAVLATREFFEVRGDRYSTAAFGRRSTTANATSASC